MRTRGVWAAAAAAVLAMAVGCAGPPPDPGPPPPTRTVSPPAAPAPLTITIAAAGDILPHAPVNNSAARYAAGSGQAYDYAPMFADVAPLLEAADVSICHLETPLSLDDTDLTRPRVLVFNSPHEVATALAASGFDGCEFASNHTWDHGLEGLRSTIEVAEGAGLTMAGPRADEETSGDPGIYQSGDATLAHLAYSYTILNEGGPSTNVPDGAPWLAKSMWPIVGAEGIINDAKHARVHGADFVVVSMHWGTEYVAKPTSEQRDLARRLLESDQVDLILGAHVHLPQPCETINGRHVFYGMGNFLSNQSPSTTRGRLLPATQEGMVVSATLTLNPDGSLASSATYQPTRVELRGHVIRLATKDAHPETYARTVATMESLGAGVCDASPAP